MTPIPVKMIALAANYMAEATTTEWEEFIMLLGGTASVTLRDTLSEPGLKALIERQPGGEKS